MKKAYMMPGFIYAIIEGDHEFEIKEKFQHLIGATIHFTSDELATAFKVSFGVAQGIPVDYVEDSPIEGAEETDMDDIDEESNGELD